MDPFDALEDQEERLDVILGSLDAAQWAAPSLCPGWSVRDVVLHLAQTEEAVVASIEGRNAPFPIHEGASTVDEIVDHWVRSEREKTPDVRQRWDVARRAALQSLRDCDPDRQLSWAAAPLKARTLATTRLSEHWIHTLDIADPLGIEHPDTERLNHIAWLAWRTIPYAFLRAGRPEPPSVRAELTGADGTSLTFGDTDAACTVRGPVGEFCRVAARRLAPQDATGLQATGDRAPEVLELIRTYA